VETVTNEPGALDDVYLTWLYSHVGSVQNTNPANNHWELLKVLYTTAFSGYVPNDDNRVSDGKELRIEFLQTTDYPLYDPYGSWFDLDCSMLEMILALSRRAAFDDEASGSPVEWFWRMINNLELDGYTDDIFEISIQEEVEEVLDRLNRRAYSRDGSGGLFPLQNAKEDQRTVELWTQMQTYLLEGKYVSSRPRW
jgi:hypothetical protein